MEVGSKMSSELGVYHEVTGVEIIGGYLLRLTFDDGTQQFIDFEPLLVGPIFGPLRDVDQFNQVTLNEETGTIEWPTGPTSTPLFYMTGPNKRNVSLPNASIGYKIALCRSF